LLFAKKYLVDVSSIVVLLWFFKDSGLTDCVINSKEGFFYHKTIIKILKKIKVVKEQYFCDSYKN